MPKYPGDPYEVEYEQIEEIEIFREGRWNEGDYTSEFIEEIAESYDINVLRAPLMKGHWGTGAGTIYGHVLELNFHDDEIESGSVSLYATVGFLKIGAEQIDSGQANERSISWWDLYPMRGFHYLLHLALLSDGNPAVTGMKPIRFTPHEVESDFADIESDDLAAARVNAFNLMVEKDLSFKPENLKWDKDEGDIRFRVRELSRFEAGTLRVRQVSSKEGIRSNAGNLKAKYLPEGREATALFNHILLFSEEKGWTLKKAKAWITQRKKLDAEGNETDYNSINIDEKVEAATITATDVSKSQPVNTNLSASAEGGKSMADEAKETGKTSQEVVDEKIEEPTPATQTTIVTLAQPRSVPDLQEKTEAILENIEEEKAKAQIEFEALEKQLLSEQFKLRHANITAVCRNLLAQGYLLPSQFNLGMVECLAAIPDELQLEIVKADGTKTRKLIRERLLEIIKEGGRLKLRGEVTAPVDEEEEDPNADLDRLDKKGFDTSSERLRRKLVEKYPDKSPTEIMILVQGGESK